jgi:hypothetical protein
MAYFIAHRSNGEAFLIHSKGHGEMRKSLAKAGYAVDEVPDELLYASLPQMFISPRERQSPEAKSAIAAATERFPTIMDVLAHVKGKRK